MTLSPVSPIIFQPDTMLPHPAFLALFSLALCLAHLLPFTTGTPSPPPTNYETLLVNGTFVHDWIVTTTRGNFNSEQYFLVAPRLNNAYRFAIYGKTSIGGGKVIGGLPTRIASKYPQYGSPVAHSHVSPNEFSDVTHLFIDVFNDQQQLWENVWDKLMEHGQVVDLDGLDVRFVTRSISGFRLRSFPEQEVTYMGFSSVLWRVWARDNCGFDPVDSDVQCQIAAVTTPPNSVKNSGAVVTPAKWCVGEGLGGRNDWKLALNISTPAHGSAAGGTPIVFSGKFELYHTYQVKFQDSDDNIYIVTCGKPLSSTQLRCVTPRHDFDWARGACGSQTGVINTSASSAPNFNACNELDRIMSLSVRVIPASSGGTDGNSCVESAVNWRGAASFSYQASDTKGVWRNF